jgi:hypothetical protein
MVSISYIGNSFIYYNNLPERLKALHPTITRTSYCLRGGCCLKDILGEGEKKKMRGDGDGDGVSTGYDTVRDMMRRKHDYCVLNDYSQGPARSASRDETVTVLESQYKDMFLEADVTPVLLATWSYRRHCKGSEDLGDVNDFTNKLYEVFVIIKRSWMLFWRKMMVTVTATVTARVLLLYLLDMLFK